MCERFVAGDFAAVHEQIKAAVMMGQRPDLNAITGPEMLLMLIKDFIMRCWHQLPDNRPSFAGRYSMVHHNCLQRHTCTR